MIADLKPYPEYRTAEGSWLGPVPSHWSVRRFKYLLRETDSRSTSGKEQLLRVSQYTGVTQRRRADGGDEPDTRAESLVGYKRVETSQLVVNIMLAWNGSLGVSNYAGIASPAYCVYHFNDEAQPWYYHHLLRSPVYKTRIKTLSTGVVESRLRLYTDSFYGIEGLLPPPSEQAAIVRFLDWANGRLERAIRAKRKVIALLHEQKQAIIHKAVTQGLDPSVPKRDSGIPWLGEIPSHWEVRRLRHLITGRLTYGANEAAEFTNSEWPRYIRITDFRSDGSLKAHTFRSLPPEIARDYMVNTGDILFARSGATVGKAFLVSNLTTKACHAGYLIRARSNIRIICPEYLFLFTQSKAFAAWKDSTFNTATIQNIGADKYANLTLPIPPLAEQRDILRQLEQSTAPLTTAIDRYEREITLLREYRTRLVADVVTGKLDVREAALSLPEEDVALASEDVVDEVDEPELEEGEG